MISLHKVVELCTLILQCPQTTTVENQVKWLGLPPLYDSPQLPPEIQIPFKWS